jgi:hypothetical protein
MRDMRRGQILRRNRKGTWTLSGGLLTRVVFFFINWHLLKLSRQDRDQFRLLRCGSHSPKGAELNVRDNKMKWMLAVVQTWFTFRPKRKIYNAASWNRDVTTTDSCHAGRWISSILLLIRTRMYLYFIHRWAWFRNSSILVLIFVGFPASIFTPGANLDVALAVELELGINFESLTR